MLCYFYLYCCSCCYMMSFINGTVMSLPPNQLCKTQTLMLSIVKFQGWSVYSPHARTVQSPPSPPFLSATSSFVAAGVLLASTQNINEKADKSTPGWYVHGCALKIYMLFLEKCQSSTRKSDPRPHHQSRAPRHFQRCCLRQTATKNIDGLLIQRIYFNSQLIHRIEISRPD